MADSAENRKYLRLNTGQVTKLRKSSMEEAEATAEGNIGNVSKGGVFIETDGDFAAGNVLEFEIRLPNWMDPIPVVTVVRWKQDQDPKGVGVEFLQIGSSELIALNEYIDAYKREK